MISKKLVKILNRLGFDCEINGYIIIINRVELPNCKKSYNYYDLMTSFIEDSTLATFCTYDYRICFKQQMKDFIIQGYRERKIKDILE